MLLILVIGLAGLIFLYLAGGRTRPTVNGIDFTPDFAIIQINDVYRIGAVGNGKIGGLGRVASLVKQTRQQYGNVLVVHAGDFLSPSLESTYFGGKQMVSAMNFLANLADKRMYVVPGNHEFDFKKASVLDSAMLDSDFKWVSSNIDFTAQSTKLEKPPDTNEIVAVGGRKVGIFALTIGGEYYNEGVEWPIVNTGYTSVAEDQISKLEQQGADIIIGLTHLNVEDDKKLAALRSRHPAFIWIAGGHEHTAQKYNLDERNALITKADSNARTVWRVYFGRKGDSPAVYSEKIDLDESIPVDAVYKTSIEDHYHDLLRERIPQLDEVIGTTTGCLDGREETVRNQESSLGDFVVDQMRSAFPGVQINAAILGGGTIRIDDVICGEIRVEHLLRTIGFPTPITWVSISGADLNDKVLEHAITEKNGDGRFLQVSGVRFEFDRAKQDGHRVSNVWIMKSEKWTPLSAKETYKIALSEYILCGGDEYSFKGSRVMDQTVECKADHRLDKAYLGPDLKHLLVDAVSHAQLKGQPIGAPYDMRMLDKTALVSPGSQ